MDKDGDILIDALRESLKSAELSITLAFLAVAFLFVNGLEGNYQRDLDARVAEVKAREAGSATRPALSAPSETEPAAKVTPPGLGFAVNLYSAALAATVLYWVLTFRAAFRVRQARRIGVELAKIDELALNALWLFPTVAGAGTTAKVLLCLTLGAMAAGGYLFMQHPLSKLTTGGWSAGEVAVLVGVHLVPAGYLAYELLRLQKR